MSTTQAPLLWVPFKSTSDVSYGQSIRQTITQTYQESPDTYKEEISSLDRCRQDALRGSAGSDVTGRDLLYKYFGQLELLELRFPEVRVPFPWKDAFTGKEISQLSLAYEKASVIFNIAATLSSLAAQQNRTSTEGIRRAFHNFRCAAGMFTYINDNFLHAPSTDLSREVVKVLVQLMLAQATEVFVERMTEEKEKKPFGLRARVSTQAAFLYGSILEDVKDLVTKGVFERSWMWLVQCKHKYFSSLAQYQRSLADSAASKHGEALTRLQIAETAAKEANRFANSFSAAFINSGSATLPSDAAVSLLEITKTHLTLCTEARTSEQRDNDLIYHEAQPSEAALTPIEKSSVGEPIPIQEVYGAPEVQKVVGQDIFIRLVPLSVHQSSSLYSEEKAKLVRTDGEKCDLADTELATTLEFLGLPASLDKFNDLVQNNGDSTRLNELSEPPAQVLAWADSIQQANSGKTIDQMCSDMIALRNKTNRDLEDIERALDTEARDCEQMRVRYDHLWDQAPALNFTKSWRQDIKSHRQTLEMAKQSDSQVEGLWAMFKADIQMLADRSGESIRALFAQGSSQHDSTNAPSLLDMVDTPDDEAELIQVKNLVTSIQDNLNRLQAIKKERQGVLNDLKERIQADDISQLLILNRKVQNVEPALFSAELEKFRAHSGRISATLHIQTSTIQEVVAQYKSLVEGKRGKAIQDSWNNASKHRTQLLARLQRAYENHEEIRSGLSKGSQFYRDISDAVSDMQRQVSTYANNRNAERVQMAAKAEAEKERYTKPSTPSTSTDLHGLEQRVSGMHLNHSKAYPPPLPPPPPGWQTSQNTGPVPSGYPQQARQASTPLPVPQHPPPPTSDPYAGLGSLGQTHPTPSSEPQYPYNNSYRQPMSNYPAPSAPNQALPPPPLPISYQSTGNLPNVYPPPLPPSHRHNEPTQYYPSPPPPQPYQPPPPQHSQSYAWPPNQSPIHPQHTSQRPSPAPPSSQHPAYPSTSPSHHPPPHGAPYAPQPGWQGLPPPPPPPPQGGRPHEHYLPPMHQAPYPNQPPRNPY